MNKLSPYPCLNFGYRFLAKCCYTFILFVFSTKILAIELEEHERKYLESKKTLKVALISTHPPYSFIDSSGQFSGIAWEYLEHVATKLNLDIEPITVTSLTETYQDLENGVIDVYATTFEHPMRENSIAFSQPYFPYRYTLFGTQRVSNSSQVDLQDFESIGVIKDSAIESILSTSTVAGKLRPYRTDHEALMELNEQKIDLVIGESISTKKLVADLHLASIKEVAPLATEKPIYMQFGLNKNNLILQKLVNLALEDISPAQRNSIQKEWTETSFSKLELRGISTHLNAPFMYGQNSNVGLEHAIVQKVLNEMGFFGTGMHQFSAENPEELHKKTYGMDFSIGHSSTTEGLFYSDPYLTLTFGLASEELIDLNLSKSNQQLSIGYIADIHDKAILQAITELKQQYDHLNFLAHSNLNELLESYLAGQVGAILTERLRLNWQKNNLRQSDIKRFYFNNTKENTVTVPLTVAFNDERLRNRFNASLRDFSSTAAYRKLKAVHTSIDYTPIIKRASLLANVIAYFNNNKDLIESEKAINKFYHNNDLAAVSFTSSDALRDYSYIAENEKFVRTESIDQENLSMVEKPLIYNEGGNNINGGVLKVYSYKNPNSKTNNTYIPPLAAFSSSDERTKQYIEQQYANLNLNLSSLNLSQREIEWLENNPVILTAVDPTALPYEAFEGDKFIGILSEYLVLLSEKLGVTFQPLRTESWDESVAIAKSGEVLLVSAATNNTILDGLFAPSLPLFSDSLSIAMKDVEPSSTSFNLNRLADKKVGILTAAANTPAITNSYPEIDWVYVDSTQVGLDMLIKDQIVATIDTGFVLNYLISQSDMTNLNVVSNINYDISPTFHTAKNEPILASIVAKAINSISQDERSEIEFKWSPRVVVSNVNYEYIILGSAFFVALLIVMVYSNQKLRKQVEETKRAEKKAETQTSLLFEILNRSPIAIAIIQKDFAIFTNKRALELFRIADNDISTYDVKSIYPDGSDTRNDIYQLLQENSSIIDKEIEFQKSDGEVFTGLTSYYRIDYHGAPAVLFWTYDVSDMKQLNVELDKAIIQSQIANQAKTDFLANMSHEIRTPMNAIIGMSYLALKENMNTAAERYITKVNQSAESLLSIINDILDISKVEARKLELENQPFALRTLLRGAIDIISIKAQEKKLNLFIDIDKNVPRYFIGDELRLRQVLLNLASNAVKFTETGSISILVSQYANDCTDMIRFTVRDTGIGISPEHQSNLFQSFHQADASVTRNYGGTGLGLSISKQLVELMGGEIQLESEVGKGSDFYFDIPLSVDEDPTEYETWYEPFIYKLENTTVCLVQTDCHKGFELNERVLNDINVYPIIINSIQDAITWLEKSSGQKFRLILDEEVCRDPLFPQVQALMSQSSNMRMVVTTNDETLTTQLLNSECLVIPKPCLPYELYDSLVLTSMATEMQNSNSGVRQQIKSIAEKKVLLVEDNELNQELAIALLEEYNLDIDVAENGQVAVDKAQQNTYDIIFMDLQMPIMGGIDATKVIRQSGNETPIVAMTANVMSGDSEKAFEIGMNDFVAKPINIANLEQTLVRWLAEAKGEVLADEDVTTDIKVQNSESVTNSKDVFNSRAGLLNANENATLYERILTKALDNIPSNINSFTDALQQSNWKDSERFAHTLKGLSATIGGNQMSEYCRTLEEAMISPETQIEVQQSDVSSKLNNEWDRLKEQIKIYLGKQLSPNAEVGGSDQTNGQVEYSKETLFEYLDKLVLALEDYDFESQALVQDIIKKCNDTNYLSDLKEIDSAIEEYDFDLALERVKIIKNK